MFKFKIGADPEFLLFHENRMAPADRSLKFVFDKKSSDYPEAPMGYKVGKAGVLGWDGASSTGEMRPSPSNDPQKVADNLGEMIKAVGKEMPYLTMTSLSIGSPIGGHIHLEVPNDHELRTTTQARQNSIFKILATFLTPIVASEHKISTALRFGANGYGKLDDVRIQELSDRTMTYEVRGASAEWTCRPEITKATLAYLGVVWHEILTKPTAQLLRNPTVLKSQAQVTALHSLLLSEYTPVFDGVVDSLHKLVQTFEMYEENKADVELIFDVAKCSRMKEEVGWNLNRGWKVGNDGIVSPIQVNKRSFLSDKKAVAQMKKMDFDAINSTQTGVVYNDDFNMGQFMSTLGERLTAFNVNLKNEYYFFGLRKGADKFLIAQQENDKFLYAEAPQNVTHDEIAEIANKMSIRYQGRRTGNKSVKLDPKTGKNVNAKKQAVFFVGIPYQTRAESDIKTFLSKVWDIEHDATPLKQINELPAPSIAKDQPKDDTDNVPDNIIANLRQEYETTMPGIITQTND